MAFHSNVNRHSSRNHFVEPPSIFEHIVAAVPISLKLSAQRWWRQFSSPRDAEISTAFRIPGRRFSLRNILNLPNFFIIIWVLLLLWGERWVFQNSITACAWKKWERWPREATPHHLVFVADPQLVDPHTYPTRPWPLSTFTELHTDNYLTRSFKRISKVLHPDTVFFLGDLFDGGREWTTRLGDTSDTEGIRAQRPSQETDELLNYWRGHYGDDFWLKEYNRFGQIFTSHWNDGGETLNPGQRGRKFVATLPGNHDLGFGAKIKIPVRDRFQVYFGEGNRVDVVGNHTFVSVDTVSLSAGSAEREKDLTDDITAPVLDFLSAVPSMKRRAVEREVRILNSAPAELRQTHQVHDLETVDFSKLPSLDPGEGSPQFPTILLTHVPLYRDPGTPCGPDRERWPPSPPPKGQTTPVIPDERNAIPVARGYQYQNVLTDSDSNNLIQTIGDVVSVFSGDDHDYCEVVHSEAKNHAREITVKSLSWAMGIRRPGFLLLSLWNPVDSRGVSIGTSSSGHGAGGEASRATIQSHLCLLPDQLGIFIRYLILLCITLLALITRAILVPTLKLQPFAPYPPHTSTSSSSTLLPTSTADIPLLPTYNNNNNHSTRDNKDAAKREPDDFPTHAPTDHRFSNSSTSSTTSSGNGSLAPRSVAARTRGVSPSPAYGYGLPPKSGDDMDPSAANSNMNVRVYDDDDWERGLGPSSSSRRGRDEEKRARKPLTPAQTVLRELWTSVWRVAWVVVLWYVWLIWTG